MGCFPKKKEKIAPEDLQSYGTYWENTQNSIEIVRHTTDIPALLFMSFFFVVLAGFLSYCVFHGDLYRILNGHDNCGNVCGRRNQKNPKFQCTGVDMRNKTYLLTNSSVKDVILSNYQDKRCIESCDEISGYKEFLNRCVLARTNRSGSDVFFAKTGLGNLFEEVSEDFHLCWKEVVYLSSAAFVFSLVLALFLRYLVGIVVWIVLVGASLACCTGTVYLWLIWRQAKITNPQASIGNKRTVTSYLCFAILATIITILVMLVILVMRKRIQLVVELFKEAGKAITAMPLLLFEPILTFLSLGFVMALWFYFTLWIESSGFLTEEGELLQYEKNAFIKLTRWYHFLAMLWAVQFVIACQHLLIAGAVSAWYFARIKTALKSPLFYSLHNLTRYHLGSVAVGSLIIAMVQFLRVIFKFTEKYIDSHRGKCSDCLLKGCQTCLCCFERILKYLNRNAYIEIAIHGYSFCTAGREAFKFLVANALQVTAINSVGDFVLFLSKVLVVMATVVISVEILQHKVGLQHMWVLVALLGLFAYFISHCFITVYEMIIDTIFLCFCEDCEQNDGLTKPYYMSRGLMEFIENSKKTLLITKEESDAYKIEKPKTISDGVM